MGKAFSSFLLFCVFAALIFGLHYCIYALLAPRGVLSLKNIEVSGLHELTAGDIIQASGLDKGTGIFDFYLPDIAANIKKNSMVEDVEIKRLPPDSLKILVHERKAVAAVTDRKVSLLCDSQGRIIKDDVVTAGLWIIVDFPLLLNGSQLNDEFILLLLKNLAESDNGDIKTIHLKKEEGLYITLKSLDKTLFFIGKKIPDKEIMGRVFSLAEKIKNEKLVIAFVDVNKENAIGFKSAE